MKERRYKIYLMNNKEYVIDEADLKKLKENAHEMLVQLKQVMVHPSSITAVEPYYVNYKKQTNTNINNDGESRTASVMIEEVPPDALIDLFKEELLQLKN